MNIYPTLPQASECTSSQVASVFNWLLNKNDKCHIIHYNGLGISSSFYSDTYEWSPGTAWNIEKKTNESHLSIKTIQSALEMLNIGLIKERACEIWGVFSTTCYALFFTFDCYFLAP